MVLAQGHFDIRIIPLYSVRLMIIAIVFHLLMPRLTSILKRFYHYIINTSSLRNAVNGPFHLEATIFNK